MGVLKPDSPGVWAFSAVSPGVCAIKRRFSRGVLRFSRGAAVNTTHVVFKGLRTAGATRYELLFFASQSSNEQSKEAFHETKARFHQPSLSVFFHCSRIQLLNVAGA